MVSNWTATAAYGSVSCKVSMRRDTKLERFWPNIFKVIWNGDKISKLGNF
jgi:hypothetical protein